MKSTLTVVLDYAKISPDTVIHTVIDRHDTSLWAHWQDIDEDCFSVEIFNVFADTISTDDLRWFLNYIQPFEYKSRKSC